MRLVILQAIQILVSLLAYITFVGLFLLHTFGASVWRLCIRIHDGERAIAIFMQALVVMTVLSTVSQGITLRMWIHTDL